MILILVILILVIIIQFLLRLVHAGCVPVRAKQSPGQHLFCRWELFCSLFVYLSLLLLFLFFVCLFKMFLLFVSLFGNVFALFTAGENVFFLYVCTILKWHRKVCKEQTKLKLFLQNSGDETFDKERNWLEILIGKSVYLMLMLCALLKTFVSWEITANIDIERDKFGKSVLSVDILHGTKC